MIPTELARLLEPLERLEHIRARAARLGDRLADLAYANPYEGPQAEARAVIAGALEQQRQLDLQYSPFGGKTIIRRAAADALSASHGAEFEFDDVVLTPGAMAALHAALLSAGRPEAEVVIPVPCWLDYPLYAAAENKRPVTVQLSGPGFELDLDAIEAALSPRTCAVLLSHPGNPTGRSYTGAALTQLGELLRGAGDRLGTEITLIADETHRDFVPGDYDSASGFYDRTLIVYSFGKYHFMQGQRLGYVAVSPRHPEREAAASELVRWMRIMGFATPTSLMQLALPGLLELRHDHSGLTRWRERYVAELTDAGFAVCPAEATMFVYAETPDRTDDFEFVQALARRGVLALPAAVFHHQQHFRLSLTATEEQLERALPILREAAGP